MGELIITASHHLKNNPPKGRIPKRWDKNLVQEILPEGRIIDRILLIEGYLHISTFYSEREADTVRQTDLVEVTLQSAKADKVQRHLTLVENCVACMAVALGPKDDIMRSWHAAHPVNCLHSLQGKGLGWGLKLVNVLHDYIGHLSIVMGEVVDLWHAHIALGEVGEVVQHRDLRVEG